MQAKLPNFLIVGAAKSGTTSLHYYLAQHPEIYLPAQKEPRFFVSSIYETLSCNDPRHDALRKDTIFSFDEYVKLFEDAHQAKAIGEASVAYLYYHQTAIPKIKEYLGNIKIIIVLRNPIDRAFSAYSHLVRDQFELLSFEQCLKLEKGRVTDNWSMLNFYIDAGLYYGQVKSYMAAFDQVKVYLLDDLKRDTVTFTKDLYEFLEVDYSFIPDAKTKFNVSGVPKNRIIHQFLTQSNFLKRGLKPLIEVVFPQSKRRSLVENLKSKNFAKPNLKPETRNYLRNIYDQDISNLQDLIERDLSHWLN